MLIIAAASVALLTPLIVIGLGYTRIRNGFLWLINALGALLAWILVIVANNQTPIFLTLTDFESDLKIFSPSLLIDEVSWLFGVAIMVLPLAVLLTDLTRVRELDPRIWAVNLVFSGFGVIAVVAGDPLTLLLLWAGIDIIECIFLLFQVGGSQNRKRVINSFSGRIIGLFFLLLAILQATAAGDNFTFRAIPPYVGGWLLLASAVRLGVLSAYIPEINKLGLRRGLGTNIHIASIAGCLVLLARAAAIGVTGIWLPILLVITALSVLGNSFRWALAKDELDGRPYWILGLGLTVLASSIQGLSAASVAWGLATIFSGALIFLFSTRNRWLLLLPVVGIFGFSALPFSPAWEGIALFSALSWVFVIPFYTSIALFMLGYIRIARRDASTDYGFERWMWIVYPLGLALLPATHFGLVYTKWGNSYLDMTFQTPGWWSGLIPLAIVAIFLVWSRYRSISMPSFISEVGEIINLDWGNRLLGTIYRYLARFIDLFTRLLEGEGGVLWALVLLIMLIVTISIWGSGGGLER